MDQTGKINKWKSLVQKWKDSGLNKTRWCKENGYKVHQMYYWIEQIKKAELKKNDNEITPSFLAVEITSEPAMPEASVFIHANKLSIEVKQETDFDLLSKVLQVVQNSC